MPMSSTQLAALVERAKAKAPPVVSPPPATPSRKSDNPAKGPKPVGRATARNLPNMPNSEQAAPPKPEPIEAPNPEIAAAGTAPDDFPIGWELRKESWHFHRRFYAIFRRPMRCGEYSHLLWQIRRGTAEHLWEDCWRVTLPGGDRTLPVRATPWRLITILPRDWQPPQVAAQTEAAPGAEPPVRPEPAEA